MNKVYIIASIILVSFLVGGIYIYFDLTSRPPDELPVTTGVPPDGPSLPPVPNQGLPKLSPDHTVDTAAPLVVGTRSGEITVRNFLSDADVIKTTPTAMSDDVTSLPFYSLGMQPYGDSNVFASSSTSLPPTALEKGYEINFEPHTRAFTIFIFKEPIGEVRRAMTNDLAQRLGVEAHDLCNLVAYVWVSPLANKLFTARNIGFSGCAGAPVFPGD